MHLLRSIDAMADVVADAAASVTRLVVGIAGAPGAGKTTIGEALVGRLRSGISTQLVSMDGWHLPQARLRELGRRDRMGAADTFDVDGFVATLTELRGGADVTAPGFDRTIEEPTPGTVSVPGTVRVVVVEGNYLLHGAGGWERVGPLIDLSFFVSVDRDIRLHRLVMRHELFGKSAADAVAWATGPDEVNAALIEATADRADHLVRLGG